jgi:hypothetical protein
LIQQFGTITYSKSPITIVPGSQLGATVSVSVEQVWKSSSISWIATRYKDPSRGATVCPKKEGVWPGFVDYGSGGAVITAACVGGVATVEVYVHDGQFKGQPEISVPAECNSSSDSSKKIGYKFSVPCDACPSQSGATPLVKTNTTSPTKSPTKGPTKAPTKSPTKIPTKQPTKPTRGKSPW